MPDMMRSLRALDDRVRAAMRPYQSLLRRPGAAAFLAAAAIGRWGMAMTGLGLLWAVRGLSGSFAVAGVATGAFAMAEAVAGPQVSRLIDRYGQTRTVPVLLGVHVAAIASVLLAAGRLPAGAVVGSAVVAGASIPQLGALSAARWSHLVADRPTLRSAFSLEAIVNDVVFLTGPPVVTVAGTLLAPTAGSVIAAALVTGGGLALARQRRTAPPVQRHRRRGTSRAAGSLFSVPLASALGVTVGLGCFFGAMPVVVTAYAAASGLGAAAGLILAITSAASLISGVVYGGLRHRHRPAVVQLAAAVVLAVAVIATGLWLSPPALLAGLAVAGATIAPLNVSSAQITEAAVDRRRLTQGFAWINTASAAGIAAGSALAGTLVQTRGTRVALLVACALILIAPLSAVVGTLSRRAEPTSE